jgi:hypothetical protein
MAPKKTKQGLLPIGTFLKKASVSTLNKHKRLENGMNPKAVVRKTPWVDKKRQERLAAEKVDRDGAERWRSFLEKGGVDDISRFDLALLYKVNGDPDSDNEYSENVRENK